MLGVEAWNNAAVSGALANYLREGLAICTQTHTPLSVLKSSFSCAQNVYFFEEWQAKMNS